MTQVPIKVDPGMDFLREKKKGGGGEEGQIRSVATKPLLDDKQIPLTAGIYLILQRLVTIFSDYHQC